MKSILTITLASAFATLASALSFNWTVSGVSYGGEVLKKSPDVVASLIYLGSGGSLAASYTVDKSFSAASIGTVANTSVTTPSNTGKLTSTFEFNYGAYNNNDVFGVLLAYTTGGKTYYNLAGSTITLSGIPNTGNPTIDNATVLAAQSVTPNYGKGTDGILVGDGGWVTAAAVPEPATGALALAGIALLLKRRKAAKA